MQITINGLAYAAKKLGKKEVNILNDITLNLKKGIYGILGPNGAGKTTLLRCLAGVYKVENGMIHFDEERRIGYLPQDFGMLSNLTVYENLEYFSVLKKLEQNHIDEHIMWCLEQVHLVAEKDKKCRKLSGGMLRRLGIAQAILGNPEVILLDEPAASLDPEERVNLREVLTELGKHSILLVSTHIVEDAQSLCDKIIIMNKGRAKLLTEDLLNNQKLEEIYLCMLKEF